MSNCRRNINAPLIETAWLRLARSGHSEARRQLDKNIRFGETTDAASG